MKRNRLLPLLALLLALVMALTACNQPSPGPEEPDDPDPQTETDDTTPPAQNEGLLEFRHEMNPADAIAGIIFMGYHEGEPLDRAFWDNEDLQSYWLTYPFLLEIPLERYAANDGNQVFCIVPADPEAKVTVTAWDAANETPGDVLYESQTGEPIYVRGNFSDILPNLSVTIEDTQGRVLENYHPAISMKDGTVTRGKPTDPMVMDFTQYGEDVERPATYSFNVYIPNETNDGLDTQRYTVETMDAETILGLLIEQGVLPDTVALNSATVEDGNLALDLNAAFNEYLDTLDDAQLTIACVVNTFLLDVDTVSLSVDGVSWLDPTGFITYSPAAG